MPAETAVSWQMFHMNMYAPGQIPAIQVVCLPGYMSVRSRGKAAVRQMFHLNMHTWDVSWKPESGMGWFLARSCAGFFPALGIS